MDKSITAVRQNWVVKYPFLSYAMYTQIDTLIPDEEYV